MSRRAEFEARCELCQGPLELGYCEPCERLSPLSEDDSPYQRLGLSPQPRIEAWALERAKLRALQRWDPLSLHKMYRPLIVRQRALIIRDAEALSSSAAQLGIFYERCIKAPLNLDSDELTEELSGDAQQLYKRLAEGAQLLAIELQTLELSLPELNDVDALQERHRITSRASRLYEYYSAQLAAFFSEFSPPSQPSGEPEDLNELDERDGDPQAQAQLSAQLLAQLRAQIDLLTRFEALMSSFEHPTRSRWEQR